MTLRPWMLLCSVALGASCADKGSSDSSQMKPAEPTHASTHQDAASTPSSTDAGSTHLQDAATPGASPTKRDAAVAADSGKASPASDPASMTTDAGSGNGAAPSGSRCTPRPVGGSSGVHFHHVHFNATDPDADRAFFEKYFSAPPVDFCKDGSGNVLSRATMTERGYFLYTKVNQPADPRLNTYLEHVGWIHPDPAAELQRLVALEAPRFPVGRAQCESAFNGEAPCQNYWFYLLAPSGARIEVAKGPGPARMGFGHVHFVQGEDYSFFENISGGTFQNKAIDDVNHTDAALVESVLADEMVTETRGKPIDHIGYSSTDLEGERKRIMEMGIHIEEDISFKPEFGFRSFFVKSPKGIWVELVEDTRFGQ